MLTQFLWRLPTTKEAIQPSTAVFRRIALPAPQSHRSGSRSAILFYQSSSEEFELELLDEFELLLEFELLDEFEELLELELLSEFELPFELEFLEEFEELLRLEFDQPLRSSSRLRRASR